VAYITDDLLAYLGAHASITPLITTDPLHIFAEAVPDQVRNASGKLVNIGDTYIILEEDGGTKDRDMGGFSGTREPSFTITVTAPGKLAVRQLFLALDVALEINHYQMNDFWIEHSFLDEPRDVSTTPQDGTDVNIYKMESTLDLMGSL
jgi:hypothetical protein